MDIVDIIWRAYSQNRDEKRAGGRNIHFCAGQEKQQMRMSVVSEAEQNARKAQEEREKEVIEFVLRFIDEVGNFRRY